MVDNHYKLLEVAPTATQAEIKQAYRRLVKLFHPDSNSNTANHEQIIRINAAYEILGDPQQRQSYDRQLNYRSQQTWSSRCHQPCQQQQQPRRDIDAELQQWMQQVYTPVNRILSRILNPLKDELDQLSADPFDDQLIEAFQDYLETCRSFLKQAQGFFRSMPNPPNVAGVAANLYYCLNQVADGIEELELFTLNYDDHYLHTGQELFRIAAGLRREAQAKLKINRR
ncbi:MAG: J domain-containing protein [Actinomycetota bacterium]